MDPRGTLLVCLQSLLVSLKPPDGLPNHTVRQVRPLAKVSDTHPFNGPFRDYPGEPVPER